MSAEIMAGRSEMSYSDLRKKHGAKRDYFREALLEWDELEAAYNTPEYNAFGQLLRPRYCIHGVAYMWSDYESFCQYCEEGIRTRTQQAKVRAEEKLWNQNVAFAAFLRDCFASERFSELLDRYGMSLMQRSANIYVAVRKAEI